jgi:REP element-mobilizing transposase RayT
MGRLSRMYFEQGTYFVTARTIQGRFLLTPSEQANDIIAGILGKTQQMCKGVQVHEFVFASNHVHLIVTAAEASLSPFMKYLKGNIAKKIGRLVNWPDTFWQRRFSVQPVLDKEAAHGLVRYILSHGPKEGLVRHPSEWPGLSSFNLRRKKPEKKFYFYHWAWRWKHGAAVGGSHNLWDQRWAEEVSVTLTPLPYWVELSMEKQWQKLNALADDVAEEASHKFQSVTGCKNVVRQKPHFRPEKTKKSAAPVCFASTEEAIASFLEMRRGFCATYATASEKFRSGDFSVPFPPFSFRPGVGPSIRLKN